MSSHLPSPESLPTDEKFAGTQREQLGAGLTPRVDANDGHHCFDEPTEPVGKAFIGSLVFAQFVFFAALLGPAIIGIGRKVQSIVPEAERTGDDDLVAIIGSFPMSALANFNGMLVDRPGLDRLSAQWQEQTTS